MKPTLPLLALTLGLAASGAASAQTPGLGSLGGMMGGKGGATGLMGGLAPDVSSVGAGNAAGVIGYCVKNKYLGEGSAAGSVMSRLQGQGAAKEAGFAAGESGQLQIGGGSALSMDSLKGKMKTKVCDMVLTHAKGMI